MDKQTKSIGFVDGADAYELTRSAKIKIWLILALFGAALIGCIYLYMTSKMIALCLLSVLPAIVSLGLIMDLLTYLKDAKNEA